jgi:hypothetical protein
LLILLCPADLKAQFMGKWIEKQLKHLFKYIFIIESESITSKIFLLTDISSVASQPMDSGWMHHPGGFQPAAQYGRPCLAIEICQRPDRVHCHQ